MNHLRIEMYQLVLRPLRIYSRGVKPVAVTCRLLTAVILLVCYQRYKSPGTRNCGRE